MVLKRERFGQQIRNTWKVWRRMEKISWIDHVRNEEVLLRVNEQSNILHEIIKRKANTIGHILRRNCLLQRVIEGQEDEEEDVGNYWMTLRKGEDTLMFQAVATHHDK
jgi:hypothetical protein